MSNVRPLHRRTMLRGLGGALVSLPFLDAMRPRARADADDGLVDGRIRRFVIVFKGNGVHGPSFFPSDAETFVGTTLEPVEAFRSRALVLDGVRMQCARESVGEMHQAGMGGLLTGTKLQDTGEFSGGGGVRAGWGNGVSVDQVIASRIRGATRFPSLELGVLANTDGSEVRTRMIYRGPADPISPIDNPRQAFDRLFSEHDPDAAAAAARAARRLRIADAVQEQFRQVRRRVGRVDRERLDRHLAFLDDLESRIGDAAPHCEPASRPDDQPSSYDAVPATSRAQIELIVNALKCDLTRVVSLQYSTGNYRIQFPWLGDTNQGHQLGHETARGSEPVVDPNDPEKTEKTRLWNNRIRWYMGEVAHLLRRLEETEDGEGGNLLDSTAVLFCSENANSHHFLTRMPFVLFGNAGGAFQSGHRSFGEPYGHETHEDHNRLLVALLQGFGVEGDVFGEAQYCSGGALPGVLR